MFQEIIFQEFPFLLPVPPPRLLATLCSPVPAHISSLGDACFPCGTFLQQISKSFCRATCPGLLQAGACPGCAHPWDTNLLRTGSRDGKVLMSGVCRAVRCRFAWICFSSLSTGGCRHTVQTGEHTHCLTVNQTASKGACEVAACF